MTPIFFLSHTKDMSFNVKFVATALNTLTNVKQSGTVVTLGYRNFTLCTSQCVPS